MDMNQSTSRNIDVIDPNVAPTENPAVPSEVPSVPTSAIGAATEVMGKEGLPSGATSTINESIPKPSGFVTSDDAINDSTLQQPQEQMQADEKDDPRRHEYWQSKHDKVMSELSAARAQLDDVNLINQGLQQNPDILNALEQRVLGSNGQVNGSPQMQQQMPQQAMPQQMGNQQPSLQVPDRPQKPITYNEVDAFNDPESESFKYRQAKDQFMDNIVDYYGNVEAMRNRAAAQAMQQQQADLHINNIRMAAKKSMNYDDDKAERFIQYVQSPRNITTERLAALFEMEEAYNNGHTKESVERQQKIDEYERQRDLQKINAPISLETGPATPQMSEQDGFNSWLLDKS